MEYSELDHLKDKEQIVTDIYEKLITDLQKFGQLKLNLKRQVFISGIDSALQVYIPVRTTLTLKFT